LKTYLPTPIHWPCGGFGGSGSDSATKKTKKPGPRGGIEELEVEISTPRPFDGLKPRGPGTCLNACRGSRGQSAIPLAFPGVDGGGSARLSTGLRGENCPRRAGWAPIFA